MSAEGKGQMRNGTPDAGFTLVEVLVVLILVALTAGLAPGALRTGQRAWTASAALDRSAAAHTALEAARAHIGNARQHYTAGEDGLPQLEFDGTASSLRFIANLAGGPRGGGLYTISIGAREVPGGARGLMLDVTPYSANGASTPESHPLVSPVSAVQIRYFGTSGEDSERGWHATWRGQAQLPELIELTVEPAPAARVALAPFTVRMRHAAPP